MEEYWQWRVPGVRVLGIDPGIATCGYGVVEGSASQARLLDCGTIRPAGAGHERLAPLYAALRELLARWAPEVAAVELLYHNRNVRTAAEVGQARGVILLALVESGVEVVEYTPTAVKLAVAGTGGANKAQLQRLVQVHLRLSEPLPSDHAADAVGMALCHLMTCGLRGRVDAARARAMPQ